MILVHTNITAQFHGRYCYQYCVYYVYSTMYYIALLKFIDIFLFVPILTNSKVSQKNIIYNTILTHSIILKGIIAIFPHMKTHDTHHSSLILQQILILILTVCGFFKTPSSPPSKFKSGTRSKTLRQLHMHAACIAKYISSPHN